MNCSIYTLTNHPDKTYWNLLFSHFVHVGEEFEIRCWKEQTKEIEKALKFGKLNTTDTNIEYETSITGVVSQEMLAALLEEALPTDQEMERKYIPYFTIHVGKTFSSEHYGVELYLNHTSAEDDAVIKQALHLLESQKTEYVYHDF